MVQMTVKSDSELLNKKGVMRKLIEQQGENVL